MAITEVDREELLGAGLRYLLEEHRANGINPGSCLELLEKRRELLTHWWFLPIWTPLGGVPVERSGYLNRMKLVRTNEKYWLNSQGIFFNPLTAWPKLQKWFGLLRAIVNSRGEVVKPAAWARFVFEFEGKTLTINTVTVREVVEFHLGKPRHVLWELENAVNEAIQTLANTARGLKDLAESFAAEKEVVRFYVDRDDTV